MVLPLQCTNNVFPPSEDVWLFLHCSSVTGMEAGQTCDASAKDPLCVHGLKCDPGKRQCSERLSFLLLLASFSTTRVVYGLFQLHGWL